MSSPRAAAEIAAIVLQPAVSVRLRTTPTLASALEPLRETVRTVRAAGVLVDRDGAIVPDFQRVATLAPDVRARLAVVGRAAAEALAEAWTRGAPLADVLLPAIARARGVSALRHEPVVRRAMLQAEPDTLFVFGDNMRRVGMGGQAAEMRGEPNAVGIPTKLAPSMAPDAFFTDADLPRALHAFAQAFARLEAHLRAGGKIVVPEAGIGEGLAQLSRRAPKIHEVLTCAMDALDRQAAGDTAARSATDLIANALNAITKSTVSAVSAVHARGQDSPATTIERPARTNTPEAQTRAEVGSRETSPTETVRTKAIGTFPQCQTAAVPDAAAEGRDVLSFVGPDRIGSNMYAARVRWGDSVTPEREWPCNELPYIVAKTLDPATRASLIAQFDRAVTAARSNGKSEAEAIEIGAKTVKKASRGLILRPDWETVKIGIMRDLVLDKARRNPEVGDWLVATGNGLIQEGNTWGDVFWGVAMVDIPARGIKAGQGENHLGRIWMEVRDQIREERGLPPLPPRAETAHATTPPVAQAKPAPRPLSRAAEPDFF